MEKKHTPSHGILRVFWFLDNHELESQFSIGLYECN